MELAAFRRAYCESAAEIDGREWRYIESAVAPPDAPALVMLPGAFGAAEIFWNQIVALGERLRIVSVTYPAAPAVETLADGVVALADRLKLARFSLLGSSLGGYIAQLVALGRPERLETLFLGNSLVRTDHLSRLPDKAEAERLSGAELRARIIAGIESWPATERSHAALKATLKDHGARCLSDEMIKTRSLILAALAEPPSLPLADARIVLIECDDDPIIGAEGRAYMRARFPGAEAHALRGGGHFPYVTRAEQYSAIIADRLLGTG